MAGFRDYNGQIVIDEGEANADIRNIDEARAKIARAREMLDPGRIDDARMLGAARQTLDERLGEIRKELAKMESQCGGTKGYINDTVAKYRRIDQDLARLARR